MARQSNSLILFIRTVWFAQQLHWSVEEFFRVWHFLELPIASLIILRHMTMLAAKAVSL